MRRVRDNAIIKGRQFNELLDYVNRMTTLRGGTGITIRTLAGLGKTIVAERPVGNFGTIRLAVVKTTPVGAEYVTVNMRNERTGEEVTTGDEAGVTAYGLIHNGDRLDLAAPRLQIDETVMIIKLFTFESEPVERWFIIPPFNAGEDYTS